MISRSRTPNPALWCVIGGTVVVLALSICVPIVRPLFRFSVLHLPDIGLCLTAGSGSLLGFETWKLIRIGQVECNLAHRENDLSRLTLLAVRY